MTTRADPQQSIRDQYEWQIEQSLLQIWRRYGQKLITWLQKRREVQRQTEAIDDAATSAMFWKELDQETRQLLLPAFEGMMQDAATDSLGQLPIAVGVNWDMINTEAAEWASEFTGELVTKINDTLKQSVRVNVRNWIEAQEDLPALTTRMTKIFDAPWRAKMIAVTETTRAFAEANDKAWQASRVVEKKEWCTAADEMVCPICEPLHGLQRNLGKSFPGGINNPPAHPNCRCWLVPVIAEEELPDGAHD